MTLMLDTRPFTCYNQQMMATRQQQEVVSYTSWSIHSKIDPRFDRSGESISRLSAFDEINMFIAERSKELNTEAPSDIHCSIWNN